MTRSRSLSLPRPAAEYCLLPGFFTPKPNPMIHTKLPALAWSLSILLACSSCGSTQGPEAPKDATLSTDLIANPKTAATPVTTSASTEGEAIGETPIMTFDRDKWDFGSIIQGESVEYNFRFTNTGKTNLVITNAKGSCGCTVPDWPKEPIPPGGTESLRVTYNSEGRKAQFNKTVTITANTVPNTNKLFISGNVVVPEG